MAPFRQRFCFRRIPHRFRVGTLNLCRTHKDFPKENHYYPLRRSPYIYGYIAYGQIHYIFIQWALKGFAPYMSMYMGTSL